MYRSRAFLQRNYASIFASASGSSFCTSTKAADRLPSVSTHGSEKVKKISRAMLAYLEKVQARDELIRRESAEYELGKRHLANMMGVDAKTMAKEDVDDAIRYLFPSGLFSKLSRPMMKPPEDLYPPKKPAQFDAEGRPFHSMFYTVLPNFYQILYDIREKIIKLQEYEDRQVAKGQLPSQKDKLSVAGTDWLSAEQLSKLTLENVTDELRAQFVSAGDDLLAQPFSYVEMDFIKKYRSPIGQQVSQEMESLRSKIMSTVTEDESGRKSVTATGSRMRVECTVKVTDGGSGKILVDGLTVDKFCLSQSRENILFPFILLNRLGQFDVESTHYSVTGQFTRDPCTGVGEKVVVGATRHGVSLALLAFVTPEEAEKLRLAGLLTRDLRRKERKKIGQPGARAKWTWKKR